MFGLEAFKQSTLGQQVGAILTDPYIVNGMKVFSEHDMPAVQMIGRRLMVLGDEVATDTNKKTIGRWVREILEKLSERDRRLLREVFLEERDKDDVCRDFGVDREYLRVLLHRAKQAFKSTYLKHTGENPPDFAPA